MGVPKKHTTKSSRDQRRAHLLLKEKGSSLCPHCGQPKLPHTVCSNCGFYKDVEVLNVLAKLEKKERKRREKEIDEKEKAEKKEKSMTLEELSRKKF